MQAELPTAAQVQEAVEKVYSRPEFNYREGVGDWVRKLITQAWMWFLSMIERLHALRGTSPVLFWLIIGSLVITALVIVAHMVWSALQVGRGDAVRAARKAAGPAKPRTAADWEAEARRLAAAGRLREAALALYQALVLRLDARGAVRFDPSKTPGDYRREARAHPEAARTLAAFLRLFEPVAFGGRALDADGYERLRGTAGEAGAHG